ncbi:hypothetical protein DB313_00955 [Borrelia turcica IST7]|uniref:Uncharacterized protein n=1 Tax=Borrelia turcica IST7 TaxID=1104446 RepID=A0A386PM67_9SPIR|nr:hypothetical protein [Borrelia turcica]AYE36079.1 hypothetical protein DB313_00955 [Borrelia turcica IST7]
MNIFLLISLPLALKIYTLIKYPQLKQVRQNYIYLMLILFGMTIFFSLYLTEEFILYKILETNYKTNLSLAISIFIKEHLYYYIFPLLIFIFFFTFNPNSLLKKNPIFLIYFAFGLIFSKNLELIIMNSKVFGTYEYIKIPILHIIELVSTAMICERGIRISVIHTINGYKLIFIPLLLLEVIITLLKVLILINMEFYALVISITLMGIIVLNKKSLEF